MNKKKINYMLRERFLIWLMWIVPIACTGWASVIAWTIIQIMIYNSNVNNNQELNKPIRERDDIIEMNKEENLTERDKFVMKNTSGLVKIDEGVYLHEPK